ncbi:hypothetical protein L1887_33036 [Cichorium endivia]|nr:hypothetical protein L1887_33036 [Cichorium endivia]
MDDDNDDRFGAVDSIVEVVIDNLLDGCSGKVVDERTWVEEKGRARLVEVDNSDDQWVGKEEKAYKDEEKEEVN